MLALMAARAGKSRGLGRGVAMMAVQALVRRRAGCGGPSAVMQVDAFVTIRTHHRLHRRNAMRVVALQAILFAMNGDRGCIALMIVMTGEARTGAMECCACGHAELMAGAAVLYRVAMTVSVGLFVALAAQLLSYSKGRVLADAVALVAGHAALQMGGMTQGAPRLFPLVRDRRRPGGVLFGQTSQHHGGAQACPKQPEAPQAGLRNHRSGSSWRSPVRSPAA